MKYVDAFVIVVPKKNIGAYRKQAAAACKVWMEHGALEYVESVGDDLKTKWGLPFPKLTKLKPNQTVVFSWILYKSKVHRNKVNAKVMKDQRIKDMMNQPMPFENKGMTYGGFKAFVVS
jgi:uncharacterized protein YbaA (DUF1428 family)